MQAQRASSPVSLDATNGLVCEGVLSRTLMSDATTSSSGRLSSVTRTHSIVEYAWMGERGQIKCMLEPKLLRIWKTACVADITVAVGGKGFFAGKQQLKTVFLWSL